MKIIKSIKSIQTKTLVLMHKLHIKNELQLHDKFDLM